MERAFGEGDAAVCVLQGVHLDVAAGERVAVMGPSGSGKSTLLHLCAGLDRPSAGVVRFRGRDLAGLDEAERARLRRADLGFVFQFFNLLPTLTARENVLLPLDLAGAATEAATARSDELLRRVGLGRRADAYPEQLSGGEMQRVALARALVADPALLLADEPTGNLDRQHGDEVLELLASVGEERALVMVTHDPAACRIASRVLLLEDGVLREAAG